VGLLLRFQGSCARARRRFSEATQPLQTAIRWFQRAGAGGHLGQTHLLLAKAFEEAGQYDAALPQLLDALKVLQVRHNPRLGLMALHNLVDLLSRLGQGRRAFSLLRRFGWMYREVDEPMLLLRARWLMSRLLREGGAPARAVPVLEDVRDALVAEDMLYDACLAGLELADAHARQGHSHKVYRLSAEMYPVFMSHGIPREASMALMDFVLAAEDYQAETDLIARVIERLQEIRRQPLEEDPPT